MPSFLAIMGMQCFWAHTSNPSVAKRNKCTQASEPFDDTVTGVLWWWWALTFILSSLATRQGLSGSLQLSLWKNICTPSRPSWSTIFSSQGNTRFVWIKKNNSSHRPDFYNKRDLQIISFIKVNLHSIKFLFITVQNLCLSTTHDSSIIISWADYFRAL